MKQFILCIGVFFSVIAVGGAPSKDVALDTIAHINHLNWVYNTIKTYNNALVLEEEYNKISPGRLNLNRIPDQETMNRIMGMLDQLHKLRMKERDLKKWKDDFDLVRRRRMRDFYASKGMKAQQVTSSLLSDPMGVQMTMEAVREAICGYFEYERLAEDIEHEADSHLFDLDTQKLSDLHEQNKALLQDQWNMIKKYNFDDSLRVSDTDINLLISILKDDNHERVYSRIEPMRDKFKLFPVYWYYLSSIAMETGHIDVGLKATEKFFEVNRNLFRDDFMLGAVAMNRAFMLEKNDTNKEEVRRLLDVSRLNNAGHEDWRRDYVLASLYAGYLKDNLMAEKVILHAISSIESQLEESLSRNDRAMVDTVLGESLWDCRRFLEDIKDDKFKFDMDRLKRICSDSLTSSMEKLSYLGRMPTGKLWEVMKDDILAVKIVHDKTIGFKGIKQSFEVSYPVNWLLTGGVKIRLVIYDGAKAIDRIDEDSATRKAESGRMIKSSFVVDSDVLNRGDSFAVEFNHKKYPVRLRFASRCSYMNSEKATVSGWLHSNTLNDKFNPCRLHDDLELFVVFFGGKAYCRDFGCRDAVKFTNAKNSRDWVEYFAEVFSNITPKADRIYVGRDGVDSVELSEDGSCLIKYYNYEAEAIRPKVSIFALNKFGAVVGRANDIWKIKRLKPGDSEETKISHLADYNKIYYINVETSH